MTAERWQLRLEFSIPNDGVDYRPRLDAMVAAMRETLGADFIDHASASFICERIDPPGPTCVHCGCSVHDMSGSNGGRCHALHPSRSACPYCGGHISDPATHPCVGAASPSSAGSSRETAP